MKSNNICLILFVISQYIVSCDYSDKEYSTSIEESLVIDTKYYSDGSIERIQQLYVENGDSIRHGAMRSFYESSQLRQKASVHLGERIFKQRSYHPNGELKFVSNFNQDNPIGLVRWFNEKGQLTTIRLARNGEFGPGAGLSYHESSDQVKKYIYFNQFEHIVYEVDYDKEGKIKQENGTGFPEVFVKSDTIKVGETFKPEFNVINPPHGAPELYIGEKDEKGNYLKKKSVELEDNQYTHKISWEEPGTYYLGATLKMESDEENAQSVFEFHEPVTVKPESDD